MDTLSKLKHTHSPQDTRHKTQNKSENAKVQKFKTENAEYKTWTDINQKRKTSYSTFKFIHSSLCLHGTRNKEDGKTLLLLSFFCTYDIHYTYTWKACMLYILSPTRSISPPFVLFCSHLHISQISSFLTIQ